jgi:hypothetical protein
MKTADTPDDSPERTTDNLLPADYGDTGEREIVDLKTEPVSGHSATYPLDTSAPEALVIHCGDSRFQTAFRRFITGELGITKYTPIIIGGGIHALGMQVFLPKNFKILWEQIKFHVKTERPKQIIIINHEDCTWYDKMKGYHFSLTGITKGKLDLQKAAMTIVKDFGGIRVRTFWAGIENGNVYFEEIT